MKYAKATIHPVFVTFAFVEMMLAILSELLLLLRSINTVLLSDRWGNPGSFTNEGDQFLDLGLDRG
jgi:uncharacterized membrane protein